MTEPDEQAQPFTLVTFEDADELRRENDLLRHEVRNLRSRLAHAQRTGLADGHDAAALAERQRDIDYLLDKVADLEEKAERYRKAHSDLRFLVRRVARTPLRPLFRLREGWRTLEDRYLEDEE